MKSDVAISRQCTMNVKYKIHVAAVQYLVRVHCFISSYFHFFIQMVKALIEKVEMVRNAYKFSFTRITGAF